MKGRGLRDGVAVECNTGNGGSFAMGRAGNIFSHNVFLLIMRKDVSEFIVHEIKIAALQTGLEGDSSL